MGLLWVTVGVGLTLAARVAVMRMKSLTIKIERRWIAMAFLVGIVGGSVGALYPALRNPPQVAVEALSYE